MDYAQRRLAADAEIALIPGTVVTRGSEAELRLGKVSSGRLTSSGLAEVPSNTDATPVPRDPIASQQAPRFRSAAVLTRRSVLGTNATLTAAMRNGSTD